MVRRSVPIVLLLLLSLLSVPQARGQSWQVVHAGQETNLRGISAIRNTATGRAVIWASGSHGVILRSSDGGATWKRLSVTDQTDLDFRGVVAITETTAYLMSSGAGENSRIYRTDD